MFTKSNVSAAGTAPWRRALVAPSAGLVLGALPGAAYAGLVAGVHLAVYGRWDSVPAFAAWCVAVGAALGLAVGVWLALSERAPMVPREVAVPSGRSHEAARLSRPCSRLGASSPRCQGPRKDVPGSRKGVV